MARQKRLLVIANKWFEAAPLVSILVTRAPGNSACPDSLPWPTNSPKPDQTSQAPFQLPAIPPLTGTRPDTRPRAIFLLKDVQIEIWCLQDAMDPSVSSSSTLEKSKVLPAILHWGGGRPDLVVAFGTAGFLGDTSMNGCVVIGANTFVHDPYRDTINDRYWHDDRADRLITPSLPSDFFNPSTGVFDDDLRFNIEARLLPPPLNPSLHRVLLAAYNYTAIGVVNIFNYDDFTWADSEAIQAFQAVSRASGVQKPTAIGSLETTHSLIRLQSDAPFLFISGITDREGYFNMEVAPRTYAQNFVCAHNAGIAAAWLLPRFAAFLSTP